MVMSQVKKGALLVFCSAVCSGLIPIFTLYAYQGGATTLEFIFLRTFLAAAVFFLYIFSKKIKIKVNRTQMGLLLLIGLVELIQSSMFLTSIKYIQASLAILLFYTFPVLVALFSYLLYRERLAAQTVAAIGLSLLGLLLAVGTAVGNLNIFGVLLALGAALLTAVDVLLSYIVVQKLGPILTCSFVILFTSLIVLPVGLLGGQISLRLEPLTWLVVIACALLSTVVSRFTWLSGMRILGSTIASVICLAEPPVTVILSALLFSQVLTWVQLLGGLIILVGAGLATVGAGQKKDEEKEEAKEDKTIVIWRN